MRRHTRFAVYAALALLTVLELFPIGWLVSFSLKSNREIVTKSAFSLPERLLAENYRLAWTKGRINAYFVNSVVVAGASLALTLLLGGMAAYAIARMRWKLSAAIQYVFLAGMMVPVHATLIPLFIILRRIGVLSSHLALILPYIAMGLPLAVFVFANFLRSVPYELEAAAFIDGCGVFRSLFHVMLPAVQPAVATVGIFTFITSWNEFIMAATFIHNPSLRTLPLGLMAFQGEHSADWGPMGAAILIASVPILAMYLLASERVERSFTAGAILK